MRRRLSIVLLVPLVVVLGACSGTSTSSSGDSSGTREPEGIYDPYLHARPAADPVGSAEVGALTTPDGRTRTYRLYVPSSATAADRLPLLVALHGGLGWGAQFESNSGFDGLAESNRFVVVYPDGTSTRPGATTLLTWNGGLCCAPASRQNVDDVSFLRLLIDRIAAQVAVDPGRVYATGHSNGAILAYRLACELSDRISAIAVQSGVIGVPCQPTRPVSVFHLHGLADMNIPIDGGRGSGPSGVDFPSPRDAVSAFAALNHCAPAPVDQEDLSNPDVRSRLWSDCSEDSEVRFVTVTGASHAWMGHPSVAQSLVGTPYGSFDASRAIWSFLDSVSAG